LLEIIFNPDSIHHVIIEYAKLTLSMTFNLSWGD